MSTKNRLIAIAAISLAAWGSNAYSGQDLKVMAGNACQFREPAEIIFDPEISFAFSDGRIRNVADVAVTVVCPVVRDNINNTGLFSVSAMVSGALGENVLCTLTSRDQFGKFITDDFDVGGKNGPEFIALLVKKSGVRGAYSLDCLLPPHGSVISYQSNERTPTEDIN